MSPTWPQLGPKLGPCWRPKSIKNWSWRHRPFQWNLQDRSQSDVIYLGSIFHRFWIDFGAQNQSKIDQKLIKKLINFFIDFLITFIWNLKNFRPLRSSKNWALVYTRAHFCNFGILVSRWTVDWFYSKFEVF